MKYRYHQATLRKEGPTHALRHISRTVGYAGNAACGIPVGPLAQTKNRTFVPDDASCKRCVVSVTK